VNNVLRSSLFKAKRKIVLIHHHFYKVNTSGSSTMQEIWNSIEARTMKLRGKKRLLALFAEANVELVLHGHVHENIEYMREGIRFVNIGASVLGSPQHALWYNLVSISKNGITTALQPVPHAGSVSVQLPVTPQVALLEAA
jgi:Icc-related predicted phosphoesterase